jgi:hypothetical protein
MRTHTALPCDRKPFFPLALCSCVAQSMIETEVLPCSYCVEVPAVSCIQVSFYCLLRNPHFDTYLLSQSATCNHKRLRSDHSGCCTSYPRIFRILSLSLSLSLSHTHTHTTHTHTHTHMHIHTHTQHISSIGKSLCGKLSLRYFMLIPGSINEAKEHKLAQLWHHWVPTETRLCALLVPVINKLKN